MTEEGLNFEREEAGVRPLGGDAAHVDQGDRHPQQAAHRQRDGQAQADAVQHLQAAAGQIQFTGSAVLLALIIELTAAGAHLVLIRDVLLLLLRAAEQPRPLAALDLQLPTDPNLVEAEGAGKADQGFAPVILLLRSVCFATRIHGSSGYRHRDPHENEKDPEEGVTKYIVYRQGIHELQHEDDICKCIASGSGLLGRWR